MFEKLSLSGGDSVFCRRFTTSGGVSVDCEFNSQLNEMLIGRRLDQSYHLAPLHS